MSLITAKEFYDEAITRLQDYMVEEPDKKKREAASDLIHNYRIAIQDAAFDDLARRSAKLQSLCDDLAALVKKSAGQPNPFKELKDLEGLAKELQDVLKATKPGG